MFAIKDALPPLANVSNMWVRSIQSFIHLKHQNMSTGDDFIHISEIIFVVPFLTTREAVVLLTNDPIMSDTLIWSFRHLEHQNPPIISEDIDRASCM